MSGKLVVGNWKMNGSFEQNEALLSSLSQHTPDGVQIAVCVPYPYLSQCASLLASSTVVLGAQNVSQFQDGAYTGEVSGGMLAEFGCRYVLVGHSERRTLLGESDADVALKARATLQAGLCPIVCIGESLAEREAGAVESVLRQQLDALLSVLDVVSLGRLVVAYEPVWAIGTGRAASSGQIQAVLAFVRAWFVSQGCAAKDVTILYGGSVKPESAGELFALQDADGGLIGGASLVAADFLAICEAAKSATANLV